MEGGSSSVGASDRPTEWTIRHVAPMDTHHPRAAGCPSRQRRAVVRRSVGTVLCARVVREHRTRRRGET